MSNAFYVTEAVAAGMLNGTGLAAAIGANGLLLLYAGAVPADADTTAVSPTLLGTLTLAAVPFSSFTDSGAKGALATFGTITPDTSADNTGTATYFRITSSGGTVKAQGTAGASACDLNLGTAAVTAGSQLSVSSGTIKLPTGP